MHLISFILPLICSLILSFFGRFFKKGTSYHLSILSLIIPWLSTLYNLILMSFKYINFGIWFSVGSLNVFWSFNFNSISTLMYFVVISVAIVVYIFSFFYMYNDPHITRFYIYLLLFTFFMLLLVVGDNLLLIFWGWEGVGLCSFLLINFWYTRINANKSALKAVFINKISDVFFFFAIALIIVEFNTTELPIIFSLIPFFKYKVLYFFSYKLYILNIIAFFFLIAVVGKSAQIGLHVWLPDAMEGPTPVSALIHAATMVTAGVFLVIRFSILFEYTPKILKILLFFGTLTSLTSALIGSYQYDIKKIIAYSTCSQLGYMIVSCSLSNYTLSLFHLFNHAFFKALLFLSSGLLIYFLGDQDIRKYNNFFRYKPIIYICLIIPNLSLCGFPFFSGAYSKDLIIQLSCLNISFNGNFIYQILLFSAGLTSFYSFKLLYIIFVKKPKIAIKSDKNSTFFKNRENFWKHFNQL